MYAVIKKAWADLVGRPWQSILIALSLGAAAGLLYLGLASLAAASSPYERQMAVARGAHATFSLSDDETGRAAAARIAAWPEVEASAVRPKIQSYILAPESEKVPWVEVIPLSPGQPELMGYILLEGRGLESGDVGAAMMTVSMARYLGVAPGDSVQVQTETGPYPVKVVGLMATPSSCTFPRCGSQVLHVLPETFANLTAAPADRSLVLGVRLADPLLADRFVSQVRAEEKGALQNAYTWTILADFYQGDRLFNVVPILLFGAAAVVAAGMILVNMIGGSILAQYRAIAVLKAIGFSRVQVIMLHVGQTLILGLLGGAVGILGGHLLALQTMAPLARSMGTPDVLHFLPGMAGSVLGILLVGGALLAALAAWPAVAKRPAAMLREGFGKPRSRTPLIVRLLALCKLPTVVVLGVKDGLARPTRAVMTTVSLTLCLITIVLGLNFPKMADQIWANRELIGINWDMTVQPKALPLAETEQAVQAMPDLAHYYREIFEHATAVDQELELSLRAVDGEWAPGVRLFAGRMPAQAGEILLANRASERLGVAVGDQLRLQIGESRATVTVVGQYQDQIDNGRIALTTFSTLEQFGIDPAEREPFLRVKLKPGADWLGARRLLLEQTGNRPLVTLEDSELPDFAKDVVAMMLRLSWVMAAIGGLSILGSSLLTAREQMRETGIRKALGMTPAQVLASVAAGGSWFGLVSVALALPSAYLLQKGLTKAMSTVMGVGDVPITLPGNLLALGALLGLGLAIAAALPAAAWGARLVTARVLHAE